MSAILAIHEINDRQSLAQLGNLAELGLSLSVASKSLLFALTFSRNSDLPYEVKKMGFEKVYSFNDSRFYDSNFSASVCFEFLKNFPCNTVLFSANEQSKTISARLAAKMNSGLISDATEIFFGVNGLLALKSVALGKAEIFSRSDIKIITCKTDARFNIKLNEKECEIVSLNAPLGLTTLTELVDERYLQKKARSIEEAAIVVGVGRAVKKEDIPLVRELAEILQAAIGYTRAAVYEGIGDIESQIGISGKTIMPKVYLNLAVSGKNYHMIGIKGNPVIISVNIDQNAQIVSYSDYFIKSDYKTFLIEILKELKK